VNIVLVRTDTRAYLRKVQIYLAPIIIYLLFLHHLHPLHTANRINLSLINYYFSDFSGMCAL